jgi:beta-glucosidase
MAKVYAYANNWWFLDRIGTQQDFIGLNYYFTNYYRGWKMDNPGAPQSDLGWYMEPAGVGPLVSAVSSRYALPIMITENGLADGQDQYREWWLQETIAALQSAQDAGAKLIGYMHWSLLDNFEWKYGWWPKFGLVYVDREQGMQRTVRPSARWLQRYIASLK